mmetsp:Transcript_1064/g.1190  ORF Transcript_1064/g.1190 Transcript_1064/m.1190 type:complete len:169 (+) Transcript_1064:377-883(+)
MISFNLAHLFWIALIGYLCGVRGVIFVFSYAAVVIFIQETINYIEHYGLQRSKDENGIYESINVMHSWNSPQRYTNYILFKLQRHSDHHANAYKPYQILNSFEDSPTLLGGYSLAIVTCICPPVFFKIYNPVVLAARKHVKVSEEILEKLKFQNYIYLAIYGILLLGI